jgi:hypothetical protein
MARSHATARIAPAKSAGSRHDLSEGEFIMGILGAVGQIAGGIFGGPIGSMIGGAVGGAIEGNGGGGSGGGEASQAFEAELQKAIGMMSVQPLMDIMDMGREALEEEEDS